VRSSTSLPIRSEWKCSTRSHQVQRVQSARDLGAYIDDENSHQNVLLLCYGSLKQIRTIKRSLPVTTHSTHSSQASYTVDWTTTATSCLQDCQPSTSNACSLSSMPPYDWSRTHQDETTSHHCFASVSGFPSSNASTTSCAWWFIAVCMNVHHLTWWSASRRPQLHTAELDSGRLSRGPWQYRAHVHYSEIGRSPSQRPVRGTVCRFPFVQLTLLTVLRKISRHIFLMSLLIRDILLTLFLRLLWWLLSVLVVFLFHLRRPKLNIINWEADRSLLSLSAWSLP